VLPKTVPVPREPEQPQLHGRPAQLTERLEYGVVGLGSCEALDTVASRYDKVGMATSLTEKLLDQRRLADPWLAADKYRLRFTGSRSLKHRVKLLHPFGASSEDAKLKNGLRLICQTRETIHVPDEAIAPTSLCLDETRAGDLVAERVPDRENVAFQDFGLDVDVPPHGRQQFIVGDQSVRILN
jgi:hypothetical protein